MKEKILHHLTRRGTSKKKRERISTEKKTQQAFKVKAIFQKAEYKER